MNIVAVLVGGLIGTGLRLGIDALIPHGQSGFPWSTLIINVVGSFALGVLVARVWPTAPEWLRYGLGTGLVGTFTTFSAVIASLLYMLSAPLLGLAYLVASVAGGLGAALLGLRLGRRAEPITAEE